MRGVVTGGTGTAARSPAWRWPARRGRPSCGTRRSRARAAQDTDAWFVAFAPARRPKLAVGVLLVSAGAGGDAAAPVAREILVAGLR